MTAHHEYDTNWTRRASGRPSVITGHNASTLAWSYRPFLERGVAGPSSSASCRASSVVLLKRGLVHHRTTA